MAKAIPEGYHTVTPALVVKDGAKALEFYQKAFGAKVLMRMDSPDGKLAHAELQIGDSKLMLSDEFPMGGRAPQSLGGTTVALFLYYPDVDAAYKRATDAGAAAVMPPTDMFWGDRYGKVTDPFGHSWGLATHTKDVTPEELKKGSEEMFKKMSQQAQHA